jgi:serine/threonine protein kinase
MLMKEKEYPMLTIVSKNQNLLVLFHSISKIILATKMIRPLPRYPWEISDRELEIIREIDSVFIFFKIFEDLKHFSIDLKGNFGVVYEGRLRNEKVAIKSLKPPKDVHITTDIHEKAKILAEGKLLQKYIHENIVRFIGIGIDSDPIKIVMEYVEGGSLHKYLRESEQLSTKKILQFSEECASGMAYLASNKVVHRDLAARNCLLTLDKKLKITDFGLSRQLEDDEYTYLMSCLKLIPIRWTAPVTI